MHGKKYGAMVLELNASDARGIDVVRDQIKTFVASKQLFSHGMKLVILDEADNMTSAAQFALRRIVEQYSPNARFCFICNYVNKIIPALQSRCTKFRFSPLSSEDIRERVQFVSKQEQCVINISGEDALIRVGNGDMRKVLNIMQSVYMAFGAIDEISVHLTTGIPLRSDIDDILHILCTLDISSSIKALEKIRIDKGYAVIDIVTCLHDKVSTINWPTEAIIILMTRLADTEYRLSLGCSERIQLGSIIGAFIEIRRIIEDNKISIN
eukprot:GHVR01043976.1.p1 GENE.GHVR01043976.1~~GHVR01043976.1.p1  ORF type:complete len:268 (+),score=48.66 GHVR01043976.1:767-1570(+)